MMRKMATVMSYVSTGTAMLFYVFDEIPKATYFMSFAVLSYLWRMDEVKP